ncbi:MAG: orotidine-5'-phosphate decarboxylase [Sulfolobales archaeon]
MIIIALDPDKELREQEKLHNWLRNIIDATKEYVYGYKIGLPLLLAGGPSSFRYVRSLAREKFVVADLKLADIGDVMALSIDYLGELGVDGVIAHAFTGYENALDKLSERARERGLKLVLVVSMSHRGSREFIDPHLSDFLSIAKKVGAWGVVAPATRPEIIRLVRRELGGDVKILAPGVGAQGAPPGSALCAGADYEIIGRLVTRAQDPGKVIIEVIKEIEESVSKCRS